MKTTSNPSTGRHGIGARVGKFTPNRPSQGPSGGSFVATGKNQKTAGRKEMKPTRTASGENFLQADSLIRQGPEPFRTQNSPANIPAGTVQAPAWGQPYEQTSRPGNPPTRSPGRTVPTQDNADDWTGHAGGKGAGRTGRNRSVISGNPLAARGTKNTDNAGQPISAAQAKFNRDFAAAYAEYKKWGG